VIDANNPKFLENALIYTADSEFESGDYRTALADYSKLASMARSSTNKQIGLMGMVRAQSKLGSFHEAARTATDLLSADNLSPEIATEARYLRAKAYQQINEVDKAMADFQAIANDTRSVYGAEAQFILADTYLKWKSYDKAEAQVKSFMQKALPTSIGWHAHSSSFRTLMLPKAINFRHDNISRVLTQTTKETNPISGR